jgi:saccharopine dehydrogenase (NAD+, L-lysine-forming)
MAKTVVLGGCGAVGSVVVETLAKRDTFSEIVIGDMNAAKADQLVSDCGSKVSFVPVDATDAKQIKGAVTGSDLVINCVGPFYSTVNTILEAVIEAGIDYLDICDDPDVTLDILDMDEKAKKANITAVIGMGGSPGFTNLLAKLVSDELLDETEAIDIFHTHGGEVIEGPGVIGHRFHAMSIDIPMFLDGELKYVKYFEEDGMALRQTFDFPTIGKDIPVFPYPHPEQLTLPRYIKTKRVTNLGSVLPIEYYRLTSELCRIGLTSKDPLEVKGQQVVPYDFAVAFIIRERERILKETNFGHRKGALSVVVRGKKDGKFREYRMHGVSTKQGLGEGTGFPCSVGAILMQEGKVTGKGVIAPEGCIDARQFFDLYIPISGLEDKDAGKAGETSFVFEEVDEKGNVKPFDLL